MGRLFHSTVSYGKPNQQYPVRLSERVKPNIDYEKVLNRVHRSTGRDLSVLAPRAWPDWSFLSDDEPNLLLDAHSSAPPLRFINDIDVKLVQRLLHYTPSDLWLSEEDQDWHYPLHITIRDQTTKNWRGRKQEKSATIKARQQGKGIGEAQKTPSLDKQTNYTRMEGMIMVFIQGFLAGNVKCLGRVVLARS